MGTRRKTAPPAAAEEFARAGLPVGGPAEEAARERAETLRLIQVASVELRLAKAVVREERRRAQLAKAVAKASGLREQLAVLRGRRGAAPMEVAAPVGPASRRTDGHLDPPPPSLPARPPVAAPAAPPASVAPLDDPADDLPAVPSDAGFPDAGFPDAEAASFLRLVAREAAAAIRASSRADHAAHTRVGARRAEAAARDRRRAGRLKQD
jgi:hypothetical protein